jgi:catechol 2,3-dioxygenase-like lactoylglutathione lyase family enzyme
MAIGVDDLRKAEVFYGGVLGFKLLERTSGRLVYDTGHFTLYVNDIESHLPIPSFIVQDLRARVHR